MPPALEFHSTEKNRFGTGFQPGPPRFVFLIDQGEKTDVVDQGENLTTFSPGRGVEVCGSHLQRPMEVKIDFLVSAVTSDSEIPLLGFGQVSATIAFLVADLNRSRPECYRFFLLFYQINLLV